MGVSIFRYEMKRMEPRGIAKKIGKLLEIFSLTFENDISQAISGGWPELEDALNVNSVVSPNALSLFSLPRR